MFSPGSFWIYLDYLAGNTPNLSVSPNYCCRVGRHNRTTLYSYLTVQKSKHPHYLNKPLPGRSEKLIERISYPILVGPPPPQNSKHDHWQIELGPTLLDPHLYTCVPVRTSVCVTMRLVLFRSFAQHKHILGVFLPLLNHQHDPLRVVNVSNMVERTDRYDGRGMCMCED